MNERQKIKEELDAQDAPRLRAQQGRVPKWELPPGYLDQLAERSLEAAKDKPVAKLRRLRVVARWAVAAVLVLAVGFWWQNNQPVQPTEQLAELDWNNIPTEELQQYISDNIEEFDLNLLAGTDNENAASAEAPSVPTGDVSIEALEEFLEADDEWLDELEVEEWF